MTTIIHIVTGAKVEHRGTEHERITKLCGENDLDMMVEGPNGVLERMDQGDEFYVQVAGAPRVRIHPVDPGDGRKRFVTTSPDGTTDNNLLNLPNTCR